MSPLSLAVVAALTFVVHASPIASVKKLNTAARVANFDDIPHVYTSAFKGTAGCPDEVFIKNINVDAARNIGNVLLKDITVDGAYCTGKGTSSMSLVSEATAKSGDLLKRLGFPKAYDALHKTSPARAVVNNARPDSSILVGFDEGTCTCGSYGQTEEAFWFFIREAADFRILLRKTKQEHVSMNIPKDVRALFIADGFGKLCLLYDKASAGSKTVGILSYDPKEGPQTVTTVPAVVSTPTPTKPKYGSSDGSQSDGTGSDNSQGTDGNSQDDSDSNNNSDGTGSDNSHGTDNNSNDGSDSNNSDGTGSDNSHGTDNNSNDNSDGNNSDSGSTPKSGGSKTVTGSGAAGATYVPTTPKKTKKTKSGSNSGTDTDTDGNTDHDGHDNTDDNTDGSASGSDKLKTTARMKKGKKGGSGSDGTDTDTDGHTDHDGHDNTDNNTDGSDSGFGSGADKPKHKTKDAHKPAVAGVAIGPKPQPKKKYYYKPPKPAGHKGKKKGGSGSDGSDTDTDGHTDHDGHDNTDNNTDGSDSGSDSSAGKPKHKAKKNTPKPAVAGVTIGPKRQRKYYYKPKKSGHKGKSKKKGGSDSDGTDTDTDGNTDHDGHDNTDNHT